jgi:peptidoglycan/xylan/chitin deacetylase (PgdA/CDA1 family)
MASTRSVHARDLYSLITNPYPAPDVFRHERLVFVSVDAWGSSEYPSDVTLMHGDHTSIHIQARSCVPRPFRRARYPTTWNGGTSGTMLRMTHSC